MSKDNNGVEMFLKALGILFTMISLRAAIKSLQQSDIVTNTQTELLHQINEKLGKLIQG